MVSQCPTCDMLVPTVDVVDHCPPIEVLDDETVIDWDLSREVVAMDTRDMVPESITLDWESMLSGQSAVMDIVLSLHPSDRRVIDAISARD